MQQADALISEIWRKRKLKDILIIHDQDYDSRQAFDAFKRQAGHAGIKLPGVLEIKDENGVPDALEATLARHQAVLLFCSAKNTIRIAGYKKKESLPSMFASLRIMDENVLSKADLDLLKQKLWVPFNTGFDQAFVKKFYALYKRNPGFMTAYAYDGMNALVQAIRNAGLDREEIRSSLAKTHVNGVTGNFGFDPQGNRNSQ
jgi:ABC-type branched-subunit amino acid transport system substrate-binding protein